MTLTGDTMSSVARVAAAGAARRRRERRFRSFWRHELMAVKMATLTACHHSAQKKPAVTHAVTQADLTHGEVTSAPAVTYAAPAPVFGFVAPSPAVTFAAPAPVFDSVAPAPLFEYVAPAPALSFVAPSPHLRPAYTADAVTTGVNLDAEFVGSASQVVGSLPHGEVFAAPMFHQVHQEQLAGGDIPENLVEFPVVQKQVLLGVRPDPLAEPRLWFIPGLEALCPDDDGAPSLSLPSTVRTSHHTGYVHTDTWRIHHCLSLWF